MHDIAMFVFICLFLNFLDQMKKVTENLKIKKIIDHLSLVLDFRKLYLDGEANLIYLLQMVQ